MSIYNARLHHAYILYKLDWCKQRGYNLNDWDSEDGFHGESFVCLAEFEQSEFQDKGYMRYLLAPEQYRLWQLQNYGEEKTHGTEI
jgi:hypothetical protein